MALALTTIFCLWVLKNTATKSNFGAEEMYFVTGGGCDAQALNTIEIFSLFTKKWQVGSRLPLFSFAMEVVSTTPDCG